MNNRQKAAMETRAKLLTTGQKMIAERGFANVSIDDIVKACGVARGTFYTYFKNKQDLIQAISRDPFDDLEQEIDKMSGGIDKKLQYYAKGFIDKIKKRGLRITQQWVKNVINPDEVPDDKDGQKLNYDLQALTRILGNAVKNGELKEDAPIETISLLITSELYGIMTCWCMSNGTLDTDKLLNDYCTLQLSSLIQLFQNHQQELKDTSKRKEKKMTETRKLGELTVSPIGMGCMGFSHGYGDIPSEDYSIEAIRKAYEFGCTFFDTGEGYGPNLLPENLGHNERIVGKAVKDFRENIVLATKLHLSTKEVQENGLYQTIHKHLEGSLKRLQTDYVDLYYLHRINPDIEVEEVAKVMGRLIEEGLIRGWGLSQVSAETIARAHTITPVSAVQNIYSMVERGIEEDVIPYCLDHNIGIVPFSPIASGFLSGKVTSQTDFSHSDDVRKYVPQLQKENIKANQPILDLLDEYAQKKNATKAQLSLAWMLHKYPNVVPIPGSKNQGRILENLGAWNVELSDDEFASMEKALNSIEVHGHRGYVDEAGMKMSDWNKSDEK